MCFSNHFIKLYRFKISLNQLKLDLFSGRRLFGEFLKCLRAWFSYIICGIRRSGWCILVLWCWKFLRRCWSYAWRTTRPILANLLAIYQPSVFTGKNVILIFIVKITFIVICCENTWSNVNESIAGNLCIFLAGIWRNVRRRIYVSRLEHSPWLGINIIIDTLHSDLYYL